jgi:hypothetical protein
MKQPKLTIEEEAQIIKKIDEQLKGISPDLRPGAFQMLAQRHLGSASVSTSSPNQESKPTGKRHRRSSATSDLAIVRDLNLKKEGETPSLRDFYAAKAPQNFSEHNVVFVYYLGRLKDVNGITPNHIYTAYKEAGARVPGAFYQSLLDTARNQGWIDTSNTDQMRITTVGENFVEHDLPRKKE